MRRSLFTDRYIGWADADTARFALLQSVATHSRQA